MIKMSRKAKKAMAVALTAGMLASTAATPVLAATQGWKQNSKGWWYQNADGSYPANKWSQINGKWYYFDANGYMVENSWVKDSKGKWYFVGADGAMKTNAWAKDSKGLWYWLTDDGSMFEGGWARIGKDYYFFDAAGVMQSGVVKVEGKTYYLGGNDQGWMQTGKVSVASTEYNFGTDGACTDEKAPAAAKAFDKKGNEIAPEVEVEAVDGITGSITNALKDYKEEYGNVLIAGNDANFKVLVSDKNGKPVVNTPVALTVDYKLYNEGTGTSQYFDNKSLQVQNTDAEGYVTFVIGAKGYGTDKITPTSNDYALLTLTATATSTNQTYKTDLAFATVDLGSVNVVNDDKDDDDLLVKKSQNAADAAKAVVTTKSLNGNTNIEYVTTQQVSDANSDNHRVAVKLDPQIKIPYANATSVVDKYQLEVNKEIKEYSVYQNGGNTSFKVEDIPAGLQYATLNFSSIDISEHTKVVITAYKADSSDVLETYVIDGATSQKNFGYQIPVQKNNALDIEVKIVSEGQVDDDQNAGLVVTDVVGLYDTKTSDDVKPISLANSVTWSVVENKYSNAKALDAAKAIEYIPDTTEMAKYRDVENNTYSYQVPVYPYTGNAVLTVKDVNSKVVGYFTIPTKNIYLDATDDGKVNPTFQNENDIIKADNQKKDTTADLALYVDPAAQAVLVSYDEAFNNVGTISTNGNEVIVNSEKTGVTALQAKINLAGYEDQINLLNNTVYTSVQWSPVPNAEKAVEVQDFYALVGQDITVKAQLVDNNGNKVSQANQSIKYKVGDDQITSLGAVFDTKATATVFEETTDANGQATLKLTSGDLEALVGSLHAESDKFNVQLVIGDTIVTNANLRWVDVGLSFTDKVQTGAKTFETYETATVTTEDTATLTKKVGSNWIFGYEVVGETQDDKNGVVITKERKVETITGLKVNVSKNGKGDIVTTGLDNGVAKLTSKENGGTKLNGTIDETSLVAGTDVVFTVVTYEKGKETARNDYKNVGEGTPSISASLDLDVVWGAVGTQVDIVVPKSTNMVVDSSPSTYEAYVKVIDSLNNVKEGESVDYTVTYSDGTHTATESATGQPTSPDGLVNISLSASANDTKTGTPFEPKTATITAKVGNEMTSKTINYISTEPAQFDLAYATYKYTTGSAPEIKLFFTSDVNVNTLKKELFTITTVTDAGTFNIPIASAKVVDGDKVVLTLTDQNVNGLTDYTVYTVTVKNDLVEKGIKYDLCAKDGAVININTVNFNTGLVDESKGEEAVEAAIQAAKKAAAQNALNNAIIAVPTVAFTNGTAVTFGTVSGCTVTAVTVNNNDIFADNAGAATLSTVADVNSIANNTQTTVTVVYTNSTYNTVTKTVEYTATKTDGAITFAAN